MTTKKTQLLIALAVLGTTGGIATAQMDGDALRCEARKMRAESQYFGCLARCDRRAERNQARPVERRAAATLGDCETTCTAHYDDDVARIAAKPPCVGDPADGPDAKDCEARLLRLSASTLRCQARCDRSRGRESYDPSECVATCDTRCDVGYDELMATSVCADGRIGDGEICAIH